MVRPRVVVLMLLLAGVSLVRVDADQRSRDLWVAVLVDELLVPVGAFLDGAWRFDTASGLDATAEALHPRVGKRPILWPPAGRVLPVTWRARVAGTRKVARVTGPIEQHQDWGHFGVRTDLGLPGRRPMYGSTIHGVAVVGDALIRPFVPMAEGPRRQAVMRTLDAPAIAAARQAIRLARTSPDAGSAWRDVSEDAVVGGAFHVEDSRAVDLRDGSTLVYVEASKVPVDGCEVHVRATVSASRGGDMRVTAVEGMTGCDNYVNLSPIAIVERGGVLCWVSEERYEDGAIYILTASHVSPTSTSRCAIE